MELERLSLSEVSLMDGEKIDSALDLGGDGQGSPNDTEVMLLTDKRVIHVHGKGKRRKTIFASLRDIDSVEVGMEREGHSAFLWATLAFVVALLLFFLVDNTAGRLAAAAVVILMGVYLVVDQMMTPGTPLVTLKAGSSQFRCELRGDRASSDIYGFANRLFRLKGQDHSDLFNRPDDFAPR